MSACREVVVLACEQCAARNYKTTRVRRVGMRIELSKYCPRCKKHTMHRETK